MAVFLIAKPQLQWDEITRWLSKIDGTEWIDRIDEEADESGDGPEGKASELLAEMAGRRCYQSWKPGLNPNVTKVRESTSEYLENVLKSLHGSVLEHAQFTFAFEGISRIVTHELVRHAEGTAISQESMRYVRLTDLPFRTPDFITENAELENEAAELVAAMEAFQIRMAEATDIDNLESFADKKKLTSAMRRFAPDGVLTGMVWSANIRALRYIIEARTSRHAEEEIRELFNSVGRVMLHEAPILFADFEHFPVEGSEIPEWRPKWSKV